MTIVGHILDISAAALGFFIVSCLLKGRLSAAQKLYLSSAVFLLLWLLAVNGMDHMDSMAGLQVLDAITCASSALLIMTILLISLVFTKNLEKVPRYYWLLYILPGITTLIVFTNPLHHLFYRRFSIYVSEVQFGPLFIISGLQYYVYSILVIVIMIRFGCRARVKRVWGQVGLFIGGLLVPFCTNLLATLRILDLPIFATPLAFLVTIFCHGIAVYYLNFLNIKPAALENMAANVAEGYAVLSADSCIIYCNAAFEAIFGEKYKMRTNCYLNRIVEDLEERKKDVIYNLLNFFDVCKQSVNMISYEQAILSEDGKFYYSVELTPILVKHRLAGVMAMFRDVTKIKEEMRRKQQNLSRTMERERLISLGQMIGSISHNLKTPIMAISGDVTLLIDLVREYEESIGDEEVTVEDHLEIAKEMSGWLNRIGECCEYMSDIITTVKGMAANLSNTSEGEFTIEEVLKRVQMFLKGKLVKNGCRLLTDMRLPQGTMIHGDINNMVQVINNLIDNACDAMEKTGGDIELKVYRTQAGICIQVKDQGPGIPADVKEKLFRTMCTTKGTKGTGLGLYSSAEIIRARFGGKIWADDNEDGGTSFFVELPAEDERE
ncbi:PAS domain S-box protein [Faecalicatena sp. AGMB00832]|uniref:PAS domain S-box protein n=1 Tax=Faecalicatena faecalis TaxID=2726362 RepID=A0ABS6D289_9FIRM|nr:MULTISPECIES: histidine kinase N-terminal 7TM domain-containing protein [Faecalicatena]MBU3875717.1 PAS domain S-box protein [Faecalicatena faecalis]MCI6466881.1 ATP-binding protein [Faecalicatena sp.]MDY5617589.1 histidine kinase N-terminal 7TM domain-containing protein [Lachnospiraceae bacterium]